MIVVGGDNLIDLIERIEPSKADWWHLFNIKGCSLIRPPLLNSPFRVAEVLKNDAGNFHYSFFIMEIFRKFQPLNYFF